MKQLPLALTGDTDWSPENFMVSASNEKAFIMVQQWPDWPSYALGIYGPASCGKTHLTHVWQMQSSAVWLDAESLSAEHIKQCTAYILDDAHKVSDEQALFHVLNRIKELEGYLLLTAEQDLAGLFQLPDVQSRLRAIITVTMEQPDDALLKMVLAKQFSDRQLRVSDEVLQYLTSRIERSFAVVEHSVEVIDQLAIQEKRAFTIPLVKQALGI